MIRTAITAEQMQRDSVSRRQRESTPAFFDQVLVFRQRSIVRQFHEMSRGRSKSHRGRKQRGTFLFYEQYADAAAFDRHGKTSAFQALFKTIHGFLDGPPSIELYDELGGKGSTSPEA